MPRKPQRSHTEFMKAVDERMKKNRIKNEQLNAARKIAADTKKYERELKNEQKRITTKLNSEARDLKKLLRSQKTPKKNVYTGKEETSEEKKLRTDMEKEYPEINIIKRFHELSRPDRIGPGGGKRKKKSKKKSKRKKKSKKKKSKCR